MPSSFFGRRLSQKFIAPDGARELLTKLIDESGGDGSCLDRVCPPNRDSHPVFLRFPAVRSVPPKYLASCRWVRGSPST
jgi:hypothetical protein